jgi:acyl-CoA thioesterase
MEDKKKLLEYFKKDRYIIKNGIEIIEITDNKAVCKAKVTPEHLNAEDVIQGGMLYTIADFTFAVLANYLHGKTVSQTAAISYLRPAKDCLEIRAVAEELSATRHNCVHKVTVTDEKGQTLVIAQINGFIF